MSNKELVAYVPVIHQGYLELFRKFGQDVDGLWVLGYDLASTLSSHREIRAVEPRLIAVMASSLGFFRRVGVLEEDTLPQLKDSHIVMPNEDVSRRLAAKYFPNQKVTLENVFLRWNTENVTSSSVVSPDRISISAFDNLMMELAEAESKQSSDWWRQIGAVVVKNNQVLLTAHNQHEPSEQTPYVVGDPRDVIAAGEHNLLYTSIHAEQLLVAQAAGRGTSLQDTSIYINVFPCPLCTKLIAHAGVKKCFFKTGSAWLNSEEVMRSYRIEIIQVNPQPTGKLTT